MDISNPVSCFHYNKKGCPWKDLDCFVNADAVKNLSKIESRSVDNWGSYQIKELFNIKKGKRLTKANMAPGITPFIGAIDKNNVSKPSISLDDDRL
jgi:hypothetical protein